MRPVTARFCMALLAPAVLVAAWGATPASAAGPGEPGVITVSNVTSTGATLKWGASRGGGVEGYRVLRGAPGDPLNVQNLIVTTDASVTTYKATNLYSGATYQFGVVAIDTSDNQSQMRTVTLTTATSSDTTVPAAPSSSNVTATPFSSSRIDLLWSASSSSVAGYQIFRNGTQVGTVDMPATPRYSDNGLAASTTYVYSIRAVSSNHVVSAATTGRSATTLAAGVARIARGPLLEQVTSTSAEVTWWSNIPTPSAVAYGVGGYTQTVSDPAAVLQHVVTLTSLAAGTTYQYRVGDGSTISSAASFSTAALPGTAFKFSAIGDFGGGGGGETQNANELASDSSQFIQTVGDNIYPSAGLPDPDFATLYSDFDARLYKPFAGAVSHKSFNPADGNKEYYGDGEFWQNFDLPNNHRWYSYDWGDAHFVVLDSELPVDSSSAQYSFLQSDLSAHQGAQWRIVTLQKPPYSSTSSGSSFKNGQTYLVPLFQAQHVNLVLSGNSHNYERTHPLLNGAPADGGITYVVTGAGGNAFNPFTISAPAYSAFREDNYYQHLLVTVTPSQLTVNAVKASDGTIFDSVVIPSSGTSAGPTEPANLQGQAAGPSTVALSWSASSDSLAPINGYNIYRNNALIANVNALAYSDAGLTPATTYAYGVSAVDSSSNESPQATTSVMTLGSTSTLNFTPTDDATIDASNPNTNLGTNAALTVDGSPINDFLMRYAVSGTAGCTITKATLLLTVRTNSTAGSPHGGDFYAAANSNWSESSVTWSSAPAVAGVAVANLGAVSVGATYSVDVTPLVSGDGTYTIRVSSTSSDAAQYNSKEGSTALGPQLQVTCNVTSAGPPTHLLMSSPGGLTAGTPFQLTLTAQDANNHTASGYAGDKSLVWSGLGNAPDGTTPGLPANPVTFAGGSATVSITAYRAESTTLQVGDPSVPINGTLGVTVAPAATDHFALSPPGSTTAGQQFSETVTAVDLHGNTTPGYTGPAGGGGNAAISFVQEAGATEGAASNTLTAPLNSTGGDLLVACIGMYTGTTVSATSVTDTGGNTWTPMPQNSSMLVSGHNSRAALWYSITSSPVTSVQATFSGSVSAAMSVLEFSGVLGFDTSAGTANTGSSASSGPTATLTTTGELAVGFTAIHSSNGAITSTASGYTASTQRNTTTTSNLVGVLAAYNLSVGTAPQTYTATTPSVYWASGVMTFRPKPAPPSGVTLTWGGLHPAPNAAATAPTFVPNPVSFSGGIASVSITPYRAESTTLTVSDGALSGSANITVAPGPTTTLSLTLPASTTVGQTVQATAIALDRWANVVTGDGSQLAVSSSDAFCSCPGSAALTMGTVTFDVTFNTPNAPGEQTTLTVTEATGPSATATTTVG